MLAPLMLPEALGGAAVGDPVGIHIVDQVLTSFGLEDLGDVCVLTSEVTGRFVRPIAVVRPETVDGP